jgi:hypothetical protein
VWVAIFVSIMIHSSFYTVGLVPFCGVKQQKHKADVTFSRDLELYSFIGMLSWHSAMAIINVLVLFLMQLWQQRFTSSHSIKQYAGLWCWTQNGELRPKWLIEMWMWVEECDMKQLLEYEYLAVCVKWKNGTEEKSTHMYKTTTLFIVCCIITNSCHHF